MNDEILFRIILAAGFLTIVPFAAFHRLKAHTGEMLDRSQEGLFILLALRPIGLSRVLIVVLWIIHPPLLSWSAVPLPFWLRWGGVPIGISAACLLLWMFPNLGKNLTDTVVTRKEAKLVTTGPYRWVRHPLYSAMGLAIIADSLVTANWLIALTGVIAFALIVLRTRIEERNLVQRFGDDYREYTKRTGRFVPRF